MDNVLAFLFLLITPKFLPNVSIIFYVVTYAIYMFYVIFCFLLNMF